MFENSVQSILEIPFIGNRISLVQYRMFLPQFFLFSPLPFFFQTVGAQSTNENKEKNIS